MTRKYSPKNGSIHCSEIQTQVYLRMLYSYALLIFFIFLYGLKKYLKNPKHLKTQEWISGQIFELYIYSEKWHFLWK